MFNGNGAVVSCRDDNNRREQREKKAVVNIKVFLVEAALVQDVLYCITSPSKLLNSERREVWIQEMRGIYAKNAAWTPGKCTQGWGQGGLGGYNPPPLEGEQLFFGGFLPFIVPC